MRLFPAFATAVLFAASTAPAHAYLDPGTGSILLQGLIGAVAGGLFMAKMYWARFRVLIGVDGQSAKNIDDGSDNNQ